MMRASVTNCAVIAALIDQPTTRREKRSITAATYSQPSAVHTYVKSAIHLRLGADASKVRSSTFGATAVACRSPRSGGRRRRRGRALRACSRINRSIRCTARQPFRQHVFPHPPGAVGPVARNEAGAHLCAKLFIASAALTAWSRQPAIEPTSRDTERPAQPTRRPDPPVLRNETELHVDSFAK